MQILRPDRGDAQQVQVPNRFAPRRGQGNGFVIACEADPRHAEIFIIELGLPNAKPLSSPTIKMEIEQHGGN